MNRLLLAADYPQQFARPVLWAVAVIAIVGIVVAAITSYVKTQAGNIK